MSSISTRPKGGVYMSIEKNSSDSTDHAAAPTKPRIKFGLLPDFMQKDPLLVTKQKWEESKMKEGDSIDMNEVEEEDMRMMTMSVFSLVLAIGVVYALASSTPEMVASDEFEESTNVVRDLMRQGNVERLELATRNIATTVLPQSAEDIIAVSIGEGIAGVIGAFATWLLGLVLNFKRDEEFILTPLKGDEGMYGRGMDRNSNVDALVSEAVADGDYFLTRAAAEPLFEAVGIPVFFASLASVLLATLPYEAIKLSTRKRMKALEEEVLLNILEEEEAQRLADMNVIDKLSNRVGDFIAQLYVTRNLDEGDIDEDEEEFDVATTDENPVLLDYVELFADITKWLEYDVLINNYRGILALPNGMMLSSGWESAIFGLLAALSSQLYTDVLYLYSDFGSPMKRDQTLNRSIEGWASVYATKCLSAATLFGVYEAVRAPTSRLVSQLVSGGVGGCVGSKDYDLCMETYLIDNSGVSATNWADSFSWIIPLNDQ
eukprot:CAMPEP_0201696126 /NCGR_PEP_ID=MMETSP0578-20130828/7880_1 /ASSEMBLY_ACC=CAM_ASM_000663 /TAXON_ID=267565 /ORGANISM="Skeletonema grethea, Strain CCMP 1804" /LENGTH=489 /DNA_ID=CAMNT_0048182071 /DNA_START=190 /DNA_END=1656 /DNA_ORIENTATION=+